MKKIKKFTKNLFSANRMKMLAMMLLCGTAVTFAQNAAGSLCSEAVLCHRRCSCRCRCDLCVHRHEQRGAGREEEDHDGCRCLHLPRGRSTGSASLLRYLTRDKRRDTSWQQELKTTNMSATRCSRGFRSLWSSWASKVATSHGQLALLVEPYLVSSLCTASLVLLLDL